MLEILREVQLVPVLQTTIQNKLPNSPVLQIVGEIRLILNSPVLQIVGEMKLVPSVTDCGRNGTSYLCYKLLEMMNSSLCLQMMEQIEPVPTITYYGRHYCRIDIILKAFVGL